MTHDEFDYAIDDIMIDIFRLIKRRYKFYNCSHTDSPPLSVAIMSNIFFGFQLYVRDNIVKNVLT